MHDFKVVESTEEGQRSYWVECEGLRISELRPSKLSAEYDRKVILSIYEMGYYTAVKEIKEQIK